MFVVDRSALAVILPLMLLVTVVLWSNRPSEPLTQPARVEQSDPETRPQPAQGAQTVAANLPSR